MSTTKASNEMGLSLLTNLFDEVLFYQVLFPTEDEVLIQFFLLFDKVGGFCG